MKNFIGCTAPLVFILFFSQALAAERVVITPPDSGKKKLMTVVAVLSDGGDFTDPVAAVESISDASAAKPYLVMIGPGVFPVTRTLVMKPYVTVAGSGREATTLTGSIATFSYDASSAIVSGADNAGLKNLTIENTGGGAVSIGLYNDGTSPVIEDVTVTASGGRYNYGIYNEYTSAPVLNGVTATASGGSYSYGIFNSSSPK